MINGFIGSVLGTCGLGVLYGFKSTTTAIPFFSSGTGFCVAGFTAHNRCEKTYNEIKKKYKIVYQSPVRINRNSGNKFFFIIFDMRTEG